MVPVEAPSTRGYIKEGQTKNSKQSVAKAAKAAKAANAAAERVEAMEAELEAELEAARTETARLRSTEGAYKGSIDTGQFILANPGGGQPLLEDARLTLTKVC